MNKETVCVGPSFFSILFFLLLTLKLTGAAQISWFVVFSPVILFLGLFTIGVIFFLLFLVIVMIFGD